VKRTATAKSPIAPRWPLVGLRCGGGIALAACLAFLASGASGQVVVTTLGGGPVTPGGPAAGFRDGDTLQNSQFNFPAGCALDPAGNLYIADQNNHAIRKLTLAANRCVTIITNLNAPAAIVVDAATNLYVADQGSGRVIEFDRFAFPVFTWSGLPGLTAIALDAQTNLYVTQLNGAVSELSPGVSAPRLITSGLNQPQGIAVLDSGLLAVSDTGNHYLRVIDPATGATLHFIGSTTNAAGGFLDGPAERAKFNQPHKLARAPNGSLVVADRLNHRVRLVGLDNIVTTIYGIDPSDWASNFPGWEDGDAQFAEAREPVGVAVGADGTVYATEVYYDLVRQATGAGIGPTGSTGGTNVTVAPPAFAPNSGYYPLGQAIFVTNPNTNTFFNNRVFYTTDGSEPTTNSAEVILSGAHGVIAWRETARDLTSLNVKAFSGLNASATTRGQPAATNHVGVTRDVSAGVGATIVLPVTVELLPNQTLQSLQFTARLTPLTNATGRVAPPLAFPVTTLPMTADDFLPVIPASTNLPSGVFQTNGASALLALSYVGTNANFVVRNFAVAAMLALPIPVNAIPGDAYSLSFGQVSGASDGQHGFVALTNLPPTQIVVATNAGYLVGDSAPGGFYNAENPGASGGFGDGKLDNRDVNNAFYASLGIHVPYPFSDAFDAMDAFPEDSAGAAGGDFRIRFLDWQIILQRSLGLKTNNWVRQWSTNGFRVALPASGPVTVGGTPLLSADSITGGLTGQVVTPQARIVGPALGSVQPGSRVQAPIAISVGSGASLAGLQFRAVIEPVGGAPAIAEPIHFDAAPNLPSPLQLGGLPPNQTSAAWSLLLSPFNPALKGSVLLGQLSFTVPATATAGQSYTIRFENADGAPDDHTDYTIGTQTGSVVVGAPATEPLQAVAGFRVNWYAAAGAHYVVESTADLGGAWTVEAPDIAGYGRNQEYLDFSVTTNVKFYRVRLKP